MQGRWCNFEWVLSGFLSSLSLKRSTIWKRKGVDLALILPHRGFTSAV